MSERSALFGLCPLIDTRRVILCVGCGGVGKTTTTAALGLAAAMRGKRVLCLTIDPARRLAQSLGLEAMKNEAQVVDPALLAEVGVPEGGSLTVMRLDTKSTFDGLIASLAPTEESRDRILNNKLYRYISTSLAGTQEYMAMEKLYAVREDPNYDIIVLDTPPTANALDFLDAPERLVGAIDGDAVRWFVQAMQSSGRLSFNLLAKSAGVMIRGLGKVTGSGFLEQVAEFLVEINAVFGGWRQRADAVAAALRGNDVAYVLVTTPDPLSIREVLYFAERLQSQGMPRDALVINRMNPPYAEPAVGMSDEAIEKAFTEAGIELDAGDSRGPSRIRTALDNEAKRAKYDRFNLMALENAPESLLARRAFVPAFASDVHDLSSLASIAQVLTVEVPPA